MIGHRIHDRRNPPSVRPRGRRSPGLRTVAVALVGAALVAGCGRADRAKVDDETVPRETAGEVRRPSTLTEVREALDRTCAIEHGSAGLVEETTSTFPGIGRSRNETTWEWVGADIRNVVATTVANLPGLPERAPLRFEILRVGDSGFVNLAQEGEAAQFKRMVGDDAGSDPVASIDPRMDPRREGCVFQELRSTTFDGANGAVVSDGDEEVDGVPTVRLKVVLDEDRERGSTEIRVWVDADGFVRRADWTVTTPVDGMEGAEQADVRTATVDPDARPALAVPEDAGTISRAEYAAWVQRRTSESMGMDPAALDQLVPTTR